MSKTRSIADLIGGKEKKAEARLRANASDLGRSDFKGAPDWFARKYFTNELGQSCARMRIALFGNLGALVTRDGVQVFAKSGRPQTLTTAYLAQLVEEDAKRIGKDISISFRGYSLDPVRYALSEPFAQEEMEDNERRNVPGYDPEERQEPRNGEAALDEDAWRYCAQNMLRALGLRRLMLLGLEDDFAAVMQAPAFVPASFNAELLRLKARIADTMSAEVALYAMRTGWDDFEEFDPKDAARVYSAALRCLTGAEYGQDMLGWAWLIEPEPDMDRLKADVALAQSGWLWEQKLPRKRLALAAALANLDPLDEAPTWEEDSCDDADLLDDDAGTAVTGLLLSY